MKRSLITLALFACVAPSCASPTAKSLHADDPAAKLSAIVHAGQTRDRTAIPDLVEQLESDDDAVRMLAINALERITGTRMGYNPYTTAEKRRPAVEKWIESVRQGQFARNKTP